MSTGLNVLAENRFAVVQLFGPSIPLVSLCVRGGKQRYGLQRGYGHYFDFYCIKR